MDAYFAFTDESGNYEKIRTAKFLISHPFYVRATVMISLEDYLKLQEGMDDIKKSLGIGPETEIKWSHFGNTLKGNYKKVPHNLTVAQLNDYFERILSLMSNMQSVCVYYTLTKNDTIKQISEVKLLKMHLQNALQRVQATMMEKESFAIVIADDLNDKTKTLKQAVYELTMAGDYVQYSNIKKGLYIDYSNQCHGLQLADICAGIFTATLKYQLANENEKHKYQVGKELFTTYAYMKTRASFFNAPYFEVYKFGVKEIPNGAGKEIALLISEKIENQLERDLYHSIYDDIKND